MQEEILEGFGLILAKKGLQFYSLVPPGNKDWRDWVEEGFFKLKGTKS